MFLKKLYTLYIYNNYNFFKENFVPFEFHEELLEIKFQNKLY